MRSAVSGAYDPKLGYELPRWRVPAPRWVAWGEASSDEVCLAIVPIPGQEWAPGGDRYDVNGQAMRASVRSAEENAATTSALLHGTGDIVMK